MTVSRYSFNGLRGIIGLYRICVWIYIWLRTFYTLSSAPIFDLLLDIWFFKVLKMRKNLENILKMKKSFALLNLKYFSIFRAKIFFSWTFASSLSSTFILIVKLVLCKLTRQLIRLSCQCFDNSLCSFLKYASFGWTVFD